LLLVKQERFPQKQQLLCAQTKPSYYCLCAKKNSSFSRAPNCAVAIYSSTGGANWLFVTAASSREKIEKSATEIRRDPHDLGPELRLIKNTHFLRLTGN
jgi:hypothetical protein